jgi:hypothetical protein
MIANEQARWIALFFLFALIDEKIALQAAHKTIGFLKATAVVGKGSESERRVALIRALRSGFETYRKLLPQRKSARPLVQSWSWVSDVDLRAWSKFHKEATDDDVIAVVLSKILGLADAEIAEGLRISLGTARYRIGRGVRQLGASVGDADANPADSRALART